MLFFTHEQHGGNIPLVPGGSMLKQPGQEIVDFRVDIQTGKEDFVKLEWQQ